MLNNSEVYTVVKTSKFNCRWTDVDDVSAGEYICLSYSPGPMFQSVCMGINQSA